MPLPNTKTELSCTHLGVISCHGGIPVEDEVALYRRCLKVIFPRELDGAGALRTVRRDHGGARRLRFLPHPGHLHLPRVRAVLVVLVFVDSEYAESEE